MRRSVDEPARDERGREVSRFSVVAAVQSPTLLNILARSPEWHFRVQRLGDHEGLQEASMLTVPSWDGRVDPLPHVVLVCSPEHLRQAACFWPQAKHLWVIHNGYQRHLLPREHEHRIAGVVCFSEMVRWLQSAGREKTRFHVLSPAYEPDPIWKWAPNNLWSLRSRPGTRGDDREAVVPAIVRQASHTFYGQDQPAGFATSEKKALLLSSCSGFLSALPRGAGFGLAEHEAFAAGVPVVGSPWGDLRDELDPAYWTLADDLRKVAKAAERLCESPDGTDDLSRMGLQYIREYRSLARMNESVRALISCLG